MASALTRTGSGASPSARARRAEYASKKNCQPPTGAVFVLAAHTVDSPQEFACWYGALVSGATIYGYVEANPLMFTDPLGLQIMVCSRPVSGFPFVGNHAYAYDTSTSTAAGMRGSSGYGMSSKEKGPQGGDTCNAVDGSEGKEKKIMDYMRDHANDGIWAPGHDCHSAIDRAINDSGLKNPGAPGGRLGPIPGASTPAPRPPGFSIGF